MRFFSAYLTGREGTGVVRFGLESGTEVPTWMQLYSIHKLVCHSTRALHAWDINCWAPRQAQRAGGKKFIFAA